jgi:hypothetical protein
MDDDREVGEILKWDAFVRDRPLRAGEKRAADIPPPSAYLPERNEARLMLICTAAAGDPETARRWFDELPLAEVYKWLAVRTAAQKGT